MKPTQPTPPSNKPPWYARPMLWVGIVAIYEAFPLLLAALGLRATRPATRVEQVLDAALLLALGLYAAVRGDRLLEAFAARRRKRLAELHEAAERARARKA